MSKDQISPDTREGALVKSLGMEQGGLEADIYTIQLQEGQIFITCSDGLSNMVSDQRIGKIVQERSKNIELLPKVLINEANKNGGKDNITVVISKICGV
jgi:protein phosphatase